MQNGKINKIWELLNTVPDPEIPVISVVELGVIRDVSFANKSYTISITPTYSGCPAVKAFIDDIKSCLKENGIRNFQLKLVYSPAWTTEWMTDKTKRKLKKYGIAPPSNTVICPLCESQKIEVISEFGATACKSLHKCKDCLEPFEHFKCI
jgi:ring-1,2-phenylacetyl-CoA epoxidase subunit PaaD|tara:strand:- start:431 stop:883 length:453 start_codon:yes stop_codon:yes gene_type:complete